MAEGVPGQEHSFRSVWDDEVWCVDAVENTTPDVEVDDIPQVTVKQERPIPRSVWE